MPLMTFGFLLKCDVCAILVLALFVLEDRGFEAKRLFGVVRIFRNHLVRSWLGNHACLLL